MLIYDDFLVALKYYNEWSKKITRINREEVLNVHFHRNQRPYQGNRKL